VTLFNLASILRRYTKPVHELPKSGSFSRSFLSQQNTERCRSRLLAQYRLGVMAFLNRGACSSVILPDTTPIHRCGWLTLARYGRFTMGRFYRNLPRGLIALPERLLLIYKVPVSSYQFARRLLMVARFFTAFVFFLLMPAWGIAQDESPVQNRAASKRDEARLDQLLQRFPEADTNKDGKLTIQEAQQYRAATRADAPRTTESTSDARRIAPTYPNVAYGDHQRHVLDFYQAKSDTPTPLIIYIHGGGFVGGDKNSISPLVVQQALKAGISVAALNYRFVDGRKVIFPMPQHDCARALQFLRSKASEWNIDSKRVACYGGSAGAGISMWLGFHDDLADPTSDDPVARQSTRIVAIGTLGGQGTYDPIKIKELVGGRAWEHPSIFKVYGVESAEEALHPTKEMQQLYDESSAITHLTQDDPPLYMIYSEPDIVPPANSRPGEFIHHPNFGKQLKKAMDELGIKNVYVHTSEAKGRNPQLEMIDFFQQYFAAVR
jgi:acetyl esterase